MGRQAPVSGPHVAKRGTVDDIAKLAGLSTSAVYMSLRGDPRINADTREMVRAVADRLNYRPQASARALAKGRSNTVGIVFSRPDMQTSPYWFGVYAVAIEMISEVLDRHDYGMSLVTWSDEKEELRLPRIFRESGVDGLIILNTPETPVLERILQRHGRPYVALDASATSERVAVAMDEMRTAEKIVEHLVALNHRRIAYVPYPQIVKGTMGFLPHRQEMFPRGYVRAMAAAGLVPILGWDEPRDPVEFLQKLWSEADAPTALITYDDSIALTAMRWLTERGLAVPTDVSVAALQYNGFADQCSRYASPWPDITCKANSLRDMAKIGVEKLLQLIESPETPVESALLDPMLNIRGSTGPCSARA
jgi:DNA-binding LacI/PurR family transcriptional regulator